MDERSSELLWLSEKERASLWEQLLSAIEGYFKTVCDGPVLPSLSPEVVKAFVKTQEIGEKGIASEEALHFAVKGLETYQLHIPHPRYFGVCNPSPTFMGVVADALVSGFNPQLASYVSSPFAIELEQQTLRSLGKMLGMGSEVAGTFCSGGAEANHTALLVSLTHRVPEFLEEGFSGISKKPKIYVSTETHHSIVKAARLCGLGAKAVVELPTNAQWQLDVEALRKQITEDKSRGELPHFVVASIGTTNGGSIDDLKAIAAICKENDLWLHVDAAWGGPARLLPEMQKWFGAIDQADSATVDCHKWFSVPMTAGVFLTRHLSLPEKTFRVGKTHYMPPSSLNSYKHQPFAESMGWSRRFNGLKAYLSLRVAGWEGYRSVISHQMEMGRFLKEELKSAGFELLNETPLPVACFRRQGTAPTLLEIESQAAQVTGPGKVWITTTYLGNRVAAFRAGIPNYRTEKADVRLLVETLSSTIPKSN